MYSYSLHPPGKLTRILENSVFPCCFVVVVLIFSKIIMVVHQLFHKIDLKTNDFCLPPKFKLVSMKDLPLTNPENVLYFLN